MKSSPSRSSTLPSRSKSQRTNQNLDKELACPTAGAGLGCSKKKDRLTKDKRPACNSGS